MRRGSVLSDESGRGAARSVSASSSSRGSGSARARRARRHMVAAMPRSPFALRRTRSLERVRSNDRSLKTPSVGREEKAASSHWPVLEASTEGPLEEGALETRVSLQTSEHWAPS